MRTGFIGSFLLALVVSPLTAAASEICDELWFTRNLVFDRAGLCFNSPLGQAIFDNSDCNAGELVLTDADKALIEQIRAAEADFDCSVDTRRTDLSLPDLDAFRGLRDLPIADDYESACFGWRGGIVALQSGTSEDAAIIGYIQDGDDLAFSYRGQDGYEFVKSSRSGVRIELGWSRLRIDESVCTAIAG